MTTTTTPFCPNCGARRAPGRFCGACGKQYPDADLTKPVSTGFVPPSAREVRTGYRKAAIWLGVIGLIVVAGFVAPRLRTPALAPTSPAAASRCVPVTGELLDAIATGLQVSGGGSLEHGQAVRSNDFNSVYFVAARIKGAGLDASSIGIWATNDLAADGPFYAVDGYAHQFSDWGQSKDVSQFDDGAQEAKSCV